MKKQRKLFVVALAVLCLVSLAGISCTSEPAEPTPAPTTSPTATPTPSPTPEAPIEIECALYTSEQHVVSQWFKENFADELEKRSDGRLKCVIYYGQALGKANTYADLVESGGVDYAFLTFAYFPGRYPALEIIYLPFSWPSGDVANKVYYELSQKGYYDVETAKLKLVHLSTGTTYQLMTNKPVHVPDDLEGMLIRTSGAAWTDTLSAWGGTPVSMSTADIYSGLEKGLLDGTIATISSLEAGKVNEVVKNLTVINVGTGGFGGAMNLDFYNSLPADLRQIVDDVFVYTGTECTNAGAQDPWDLEVIKTFENAGVEVYYPTAAEMELWKAPAKQIIDNWVAGMEAKGLPGQQMLDDLIAIAAKYGATPYS